MSYFVISQNDDGQPDITEYDKAQLETALGPDGEYAGRKTPKVLSTVTRYLVPGKPIPDVAAYPGREGRSRLCLKDQPRRMNTEAKPQPAPFMVYTTQRHLGYPVVVFEVRQVIDDIAIGVAEAQGMARESVPLGELRVPVVELIRPALFPHAWRLALPDTFRAGWR